MPKIELAGLSGKFGSMEDLENEPPVGWLLKDWLASREISCIYGQGGTFKSYIALAWSLQLAVRRLPVLYVAAEGTSGLRSRVEAWMASKGRHGKALKAWSYYNSNVHIDDDSEVGMWVSALESYVNNRDTAYGNPDLIVVDTMARNFQGDENSAKEVGMFVEGCEYLRRELDTAVLIIHHMGVSTGRERGTAALRNATFAMFKTSRPKYSDLGGGSVLLECDRMKDAPMPEPVRCYFDTVALNVDHTGEVFQQSQAMRNFPPTGKEKPQRSIIKSEE